MNLYLPALMIGLASLSHAAVIQSYSDQNNIPNYSTGTSLGGFSVTDTPDLYVGYTLDWNNGSVGTNKFVVLFFDDINSGVNYGLKSNEGPSNTDFVIRYGASSPLGYSPYQITVPDSVRVVGSLEYNSSSGNYDTASLWINPGTGDLGDPDFTISGFTMATPSLLGLRSVNLSLPADDIDLLNIVVTDDFASAVPEPATCLMSLLGACLVLRRRRS